jgi:hypothetical protein
MCVFLSHYVIISLRVFYSPECSAVWIAMMIAKLGASSSRAVQVLFSNKAIVSVMGNQVRFQIRVFDVNARHPVVGPHVRLYAVRKDKPVPWPMRLIQPNDELGGSLFLSLPQVICHHIDLYSVLHPPKADNPLLAEKNGLDLRETDSATCKRTEVVCPVCSETFGMHDQWIRHVKYLQLAESLGQTPALAAHGRIQGVELSLDRYKPTTNLDILRTYFEQEISEVICAVEGTDPLTSGAFSALHSYQASDILWDHGSSFHPCISVDSSTYRVDLDRFHDISKTPVTRRHHQLSSRPHDSFFAANHDQPNR